jgi:hypothetical protein
VSTLLSGQPLVLNDRPGGKTANPGTLAVSSAHITRFPSFLDYISEVSFPSHLPSGGPPGGGALNAGTWNSAIAHA